MDDIERKKKEEKMKAQEITEKVRNLKIRKSKERREDVTRGYMPAEKRKKHRHIPIHQSLAKRTLGQEKEGK